MITNYLEKTYEDFDYIDWVDSELPSHEDEIKKYICNIVTEIADDIFSVMYMDI